MKSWMNVFVGCILWCLLTGCSTRQDLVIPSPPKQDLVIPKQDPVTPSLGKGDLITLPPENRELIVLLLDPDGKVGAIQVTTEGGSQTIEKPNYSTQIEHFSKPPTSPKPLDDNEIMRLFGPALLGQTDLKGRFVSFVLYFESDSTKLAYESKILLPEVIRSIKSRKSKEVYVVGHTDRVGAEIYNRGLSLRRANYVRDQLLLRNVKTSVLVVSFHGEAMPLVNTEDEVAEPLNRRVEVIVR